MLNQQLTQYIQELDTRRVQLSQSLSQISGLLPGENLSDLEKGLNGNFLRDDIELQQLLDKINQFDLALFQFIYSNALTPEAKCTPEIKKFFKICQEHQTWSHDFARTVRAEIFSEAHPPSTLSRHASCPALFIAHKNHAGAVVPAAPNI